MMGNPWNSYSSAAVKRQELGFWTLFNWDRGQVGQRWVSELVWLFVFKRETQYPMVVQNCALYSNSSKGCLGVRPPRHIPHRGSLLCKCELDGDRERTQTANARRFPRASERRVLLIVGVC